MTIEVKDYTRADLQSAQEVRWCPGCGDYTILATVQNFLAEMGIARENHVFISGIGCSSRFPYYMNTYGMHSIHGRAPAIATGLATARPDLSVWVITGDGDGLSIGGNHLIHAMRKNTGLKILMFNNRIYGLTKGQTSPTSDPGFVTKTTPYGASPPINPIALAIAGGATFVARGFAGNVDHLAGLIKSGIQHRGFAIIDILQPCVSFNHKNTYSWYRERVYQLGEDYDPSNQLVVLEKAQEWGDRIPIGVIYRVQRPTFEEQIPALKKGPLVSQKLEQAKVERVLAELL